MNIENIKNTIVNGLKEDCKKHNFKQVLLGLSGGMDSALVLALAIEAMGAENVHTIMLKTQFTSQLSLDLSKEMAQKNGIDYKVIDIEPMVQEVKNGLDFAAKNPFTYQNIQARIRGVVLMAYANEYGYQLLACGNKSEAAMGYCTLYGDICGGISPIGDVLKTDVYKLAEYINNEGKIIIPQGIINRAPSAELAKGQKDTDSLPSYDRLDYILKNYVFDNKEILLEQKEEVEAIKQRYEFMAFKRAQAPFSIKID